MIKKYKHTILNTWQFNNEELISIVYQILYDNKQIQYINMSPETIEFGTVEVLD